MFVPGQVPFRWLLPAVGFVAAVLALSTRTSPLRAAIAVSAAWLVVVLLLVTQFAPGPEVSSARRHLGWTGPERAPMPG